MHQRAGLRKSRVLHFNTRNGMYADIIQKLSPNSDFNVVSNPIVYAPQYDDPENQRAIGRKNLEKYEAT